MVDYESMIKARAGFQEAMTGARADIELAVSCIMDAFRSGRQLFICGNGGSAADSQHMAAEFVGRFGLDRRGLPAIALTTDSSALTAISNDWNYEYVFRRQLEALGRQDDVLLGISTSGESKNIVEALAHARHAGIRTIGLVGKSSSKMASMCEVLINVGGASTPVIQERQLAVEHIICEAVEEMLRHVGAL